MRCFIAGGLLGISATLVLADTPAERAASLSKLSPDQKEELLRKKQRFDALDPAEQQRLRELHAALSAGADAEQLHTTAVRYANWLKGLQPGERAEVLSLPADKRIVRIREIVSQQERQRFRDLSNLPPNDQEFVYQWLDKFVADNEKAILEAIPSYRDRRDIRETKDDRAR
ncbi:MAG TPA: hypothetical protein VFV87_15185, partial [Pirellulaceae bacterium]|nr:hypothetical protein [Pirellulaceae bacterium]